jgi:hypothetical protein
MYFSPLFLLLSLHIMLNKNKCLNSHVCLSVQPIDRAAVYFILRTTEQILMILHMNVSTLNTTPNSYCFQFPVFDKNNVADALTFEVGASLSPLVKCGNRGNENIQSNKCSEG